MEEDQKEEVFKEPRQLNGTLRPGRESPVKRYLVIATSIIVIGLLIFGVLRFLGGAGESDENQNAIPTPTIEEIPTETPSPTEAGTPMPTEKPTVTPKPTVNPIDSASGLNRNRLSIRVLNGSGVTGAAKKAGDFLEGLGYNVIQVGNAPTSDYEQTQIQIKSASSTYLSLLKKDLSANYTVGATSSDLAATESANAIVIIGKQ